MDKLEIREIVKVCLVFAHDKFNLLTEMFHKRLLVQGQKGIMHDLGGIGGIFIQTLFPDCILGLVHSLQGFIKLVKVFEETLGPSLGILVAAIDRRELFGVWRRNDRVRYAAARPQHLLDLAILLLAFLGNQRLVAR